ncbi:MAG: methylated-DNA--[protein]-cysteine S-methyltransferase [Oceanobacter sp.]
MDYTRFETRFCEVILAGDEQGLQHLHLNTGDGKKGPFELPADWQRNDALFEPVKAQVLAYCAGELRQFDVRLNPQGTEFQQTVWRALQDIPCGELRTYGEIAKQLGKPTASRAVGAANGRNPIPLIIPCHRVVGSQGKLTGFAHGLEIKQQLIEWESRPENPKP